MVCGPDKGHLAGMSFTGKLKNADNTDKIALKIKYPCQKARWFLK
jgi:hypothetical protein